MIDVLTLTHEGRLAVVELKADEDIHLPLQGLDYWARVQWHHGRGEFLKFGYFSGRVWSEDSPLLFLVAPALHVHPSTGVLWRYISPEIEWAFVGNDERWREERESSFASGAPLATGMPTCEAIGTARDCQISVSGLFLCDYFMRLFPRSQ
jgi:hypothetical protein